MGRSDWKATIFTGIALLAAGCQQADGPTEQSERLRERLSLDAEQYFERSVSDLRSNAAAMRIGEQLFDTYCGSCHAVHGLGGRGTIDLSRRVFNYGKTEQSIRTTVSEGRMSVMPGVGRELGEVDLGQLVAFVRSLEFESPLSSYAERGKQLFEESCAQCHGAYGLGNPELGAPSLVDDYWQHGDSMMNIRLVITRGVESACPGFVEEESPAAIELLTAYVLSFIDQPAQRAANHALAK